MAIGRESYNINRGAVDRQRSRDAERARRRQERAFARSQAKATEANQAQARRAQLQVMRDAVGDQSIGYATMRDPDRGPANVLAYQRDEMGNITGAKTDQTEFVAPVIRPDQQRVAEENFERGFMRRDLAPKIAEVRQSDPMFRLAREAEIAGRTVQQQQDFNIAREREAAERQMIESEAALRSAQAADIGAAREQEGERIGIESYTAEANAMLGLSELDLRREQQAMLDRMSEAELREREARLASLPERVRQEVEMGEAQIELLRAQIEEARANGDAQRAQQMLGMAEQIQMGLARNLQVAGALQPQPVPSGVTIQSLPGERTKVQIRIGDTTREYTVGDGIGLSQFIGVASGEGSNMSAEDIAYYAMYISGAAQGSSGEQRTAQQIANIMNVNLPRGVAQVTPEEVIDMARSRQRDDVMGAFGQ